MKTDTKVLDVVSTLAGERVSMTLDPDSVAHIMAVLTDLYSDPTMAVIREYSTNAYDSHVEAGIDRPIEVTLPSAFSLFFKVRDYGVGLDADGIREIYSQYGNSTKRDSNDVVGMLGLGCKSALTYTDQFMLTGIKNGICTQVAVSRDTDGGGSMTIVAEYPTDEPSGVEVVVPVKAQNDFARKSEKFFRFWKPGTVLVNDQEPAKIEGFWLSDNMVLTSDFYDHNRTDYVVMGNVAYPAGKQLWEQSWRNNKQLVTFVEIGDVNFTPSREALQHTPKTVSTLEDIQRKALALLDERCEEKLAEAKTPQEALTTLLEIQDLGYSKKNPEWNGVPIPDHINYPEGDKRSFLSVSTRQGWGNGKGHKNGLVYTRSLHKHIFLVGHKDESFTPYKRKKLIQWVGKNQLPTHDGTFFLVDTLTKEMRKWIDPTRIHNWDDVAAEKIVRGPSNGLNGAYKVITSNTSGVETLDADDIDGSKTVIYYHRDDSVSAALAEKYAPGGLFYLVEITRNRIGKLLKSFPNAIHFHDWYKQIALTWFDNLKEDERQYLKHKDSSDLRIIANFEQSKVNDPELKSLIKIAKASKAREELDREWNRFKRWFDFSTYDELPALNRYPLLRNGYFSGTLDNEIKKHLYLYINAAHNAAEGVVTQ